MRDEPRKPGRPPGRKPQGKPLYVRLTPEDREKLDKHAASFGMTLSERVRHLLKVDWITPRVRKK